MADRLDEYRSKRDASRTPEPAGDGTVEADGAGPRFVVQEHHATHLHWDLRLEHDGVAVSWALPRGLPHDPGENRFAAHTEDHPLQYLEFEGTIPAGEYGAGEMHIWDRGTFEVHEFTDAKVEVTLHGERVSGRYGLFPMHRKKGEAPGKDWLIHRMDPPADPHRVAMPRGLKPMLAKPGALPADGERWAYEVKWDGVRALVSSAPGSWRIDSRNGNDVTVSYPELERIGRALGSHEAILDGEIVAFDEHGLPSFPRLQARMHINSEAAARRRAKDTPVVFQAFDLLYLDGHSTTGLTYAERRELLEALELDGRHWKTPGELEGTAAEVLEATRALGLEGVVAKRRDGPYEPGRRSGGWVKARNDHRIDVVVGGWTHGEGGRAKSIGALVVGIPSDGGLRYVGRVGSGLDTEQIERLNECLRPRESSPFDGRQPEHPGGVNFVEPTCVAEVRFANWTPDDLLRFPVWLGLREEETTNAAFLTQARSVKGGQLVRVGEHELKLTNLDKVLYPAVNFAKRDVIAYLAQIAPVLLTHLSDRPITRKRYPDGVEGKAFFEKQCPPHRPDWAQTVQIPSDGKVIDFCLIPDAAHLVWLGNLAALELHASLSRAGSYDTPTAVVFDLDPGPPATIVECCRVGVLLEGMLSGLGLESFAKTSGSKGLQVYLPLNDPDVTYVETRAFAKAVAELLAASEPGLVVAQMSKDKRRGKVYVDWMQNDDFKTTIGVYSLRARERPTVSTPVSWDEVRSCRDSEDPDDLVFEATDVLARVEEHGDLFASVHSTVQRLPALG